MLQRLAPRLSVQEGSRSQRPTREGATRRRRGVRHVRRTSAAAQAPGRPRRRRGCSRRSSLARSSLARIGLDTDIADGLLNDLAASGVTVLTNTSADTFEHGESGLTVSLKGKDGSDTPAQIECDVFLAAMGRRPSSGGLGLAEIGGVIDAKSGVIKVENFKVEGAKSSIYAAGDVIGPPALASTGVEQAKAAIAAMFAEATEDAQVGSDNFPVGVWVSAAPAAQPVAPMPTYA